MRQSRTWPTMPAGRCNENEWGLTRPETVAETNYKVHSPAWGLGFQKLAHEAGVVCHVKYPGHPTEGYQDIWDFLVKELKAGTW